MSRQNDEKKYPPAKAGPKGPLPQGPSRPFTFHPTEAQRISLRENPMNSGEAWSVISEWVERGCKLIVGYKAENAAFYALLREGTDNWQEGKAISVFHSQLEKCFAGLSFYLLHVNPEWPASNGGWTQTEFDW
jgi:hypothetical protein